MDNEIVNSSSSSGVGFTGLLQVAFIVLKLTHVINWKWVWVLAPTWISMAIVVVVALLVLIIFLIVKD